MCGLEEEIGARESIAEFGRAGGSHCSSSADNAMSVLVAVAHADLSLAVSTNNMEKGESWRFSRLTGRGSVVEALRLDAVAVRSRGYLKTYQNRMRLAR